MSLIRFTAQGGEPLRAGLGPVVDALNGRRTALSQVPIAQLLDGLDAFAKRLIRDPRTQSIEGVAFLSAWLGRHNLQRLLELNLNGNLAYLDGFVPFEPATATSTAAAREPSSYLAAKPQGLVAMWMAGNVATLPLFSLVTALLAKNVCLVKLATADPAGIVPLIEVLAECETPGFSGAAILEAAAIVWFDYRDRALNEAMSLAADARVVWGGAEAIAAITALPRREHCVDLVFGPKYSIGVIGQKRLEEGGDELDRAVAGFVRDVAAFDQRACSAPQTIFIERNARYSLRQVGELFAQRLGKLPPKSGLDAYTTMQILAARAECALDPARDVLASNDGANWTVCLDRQASLKPAVQSRTIFLSEIESWRDILPLLSPKVQTAGVAFADTSDALAFAEAATAAGVARCVRPGIMNNFELPWDGKLLASQLVRWVTLKR